MKGNKPTRRDVMKGAVAATGGAMLAPMPLFGGDRPGPKPGKAKAVIQIWLWGGPAHTDLFDPKPKAGRDYTGPLTNPIETSVSGVRICQTLPQLS